VVAVFRSHFFIFSGKWKNSSDVRCQAYSLMILNDLSSSTVIDAIQSQIAADQAFAYFYIDFSEAKTRQPKYILRSLLAQLIARKPEMIQADFHDLMQSMKDNSDPPFDALELSDLIMRASGHYSDVTLVIDAVDECMPREEFLPFFKRLEPENNIRVYVTSRRERDIRDLFVGRPDIPLEGVRDSVLADMESHIRSELESGIGYSKIPNRIKDEIIRSLLQGSGGMYVFLFGFRLRLYTLKLIHLPGRTHISKVSVDSVSTGPDPQNENEQEDLGSVENPPIRIVRNVRKDSAKYCPRRCLVCQKDHLVDHCRGSTTSPTGNS
jgi:hypothetical protein